MEYKSIFRRVVRDDPQGPVSKIMMQKLDNATGKPIGDPKIFKDFRPTQYIYSVHNYKSMAVTPKGNIVFYMQYDESCGKHLLFGQILNPETSKNIGTPQVLVGCDSSYNNRDFQEIDVAELE